MPNNIFSLHTLPDAKPPDFARIRFLPDQIMAIEEQQAFIYGKLIRASIKIGSMLSEEDIKQQQLIVAGYKGQLDLIAALLTDQNKPIED